MVLRRTSVVGLLSANDISLSSIVRIGDQEQFEPRLRALAVVDDTDRGWTEEVYFPSYPLFQLPRPEWPDSLTASVDGTEPIILSKTDANPAIRAGVVNVIAMAGSSLLLVGSCGKVEAEARLKKIRIVRGRA
ncbi:hypothetical protein DNH61_22485 [Paenibacillus sambharensis]|uniref:Spore germination protein GerPE n=1 Tax=Paenibacillus sambharensis TaxID=1803190 RepID=A0A2W1LEC1_9BACL|nr:spore germination protein GerPE [Paenibacillus sambharensis]PZD93402.1 hypothetical protein DNH61_22485 [Paenibacillus sambharensis]